MQTEEQYKV